MKNMFRIVAAVAALAASSAHAETLRIATEGAYPPFNFVDASGEVKGFDVDIAKALCAEMKVECTIETYAWDGMIPGLNAGKFDAIVASMSITEKRKEAVNFTRPYYQAGAILVGPKGADIALTSEGLDGKAIGVQRASSYGVLLKDKFPGATLREYDKVEEHNFDLAAGRVDAVMAQRLFMHGWLVSEEGKDFEQKGDVIYEPDYLGPGAGIAIRKSDNELLERFNTALTTILSNGVYDEINDRYFPVSLNPQSK